MFSGIGGFEYGINEAFRNPDVQEKRRRQEAESGTPQKNRGRLHSIPEQGALSPADRDHEHSDIGIDQRQPHCVGFSEINEPATRVYQQHYKEHKNYGDATKINASELPDFEVLVGGFPCQAFSLAGKRRGLDDTRGTLFFDIARVAEHKRPKYLVLENVKGLLSHDSGKTIHTILEVFTKIGYQLQWCVLNSKDFGVPQNRERIYIVGYLGEGPAPQVFPLRSCYQTADQVRNQNDKLSGDSRDSEGKIRGSTERREVSKTIRVGGQGSPHGSKQNWDSYEVEGTIRRLTPLECERLQGFPDNWTKIEIEARSKAKRLLGLKEYMSDNQRYKMCGNAVTTNVVQAVFTELFLQDGSLL